MTHTRHTPLLLICLGYLLLAISFSLTIPLFETPDEHHHYYMVRHLATQRQFPIIGIDEGLARQEAAQPPLYYILGAILITPIDVETTLLNLWLNPYVQLGDATTPDNINAFIHTPTEAWPWQGDVLAAHLLRLFSALLGLGTLLGVHGCTRQLWPQHPECALIATALVAFMPQFLFIHASITNDTAVTCFSTLALWQLLRLWRLDLTPKRLTLLGTTIGLTILSKMAGLALLGLATLALCWLLWQKGDLFKNGRFQLSPLFTTLTPLILPALLLSGWLFWRNWTLYGDPTAANQFVLLAGGNRAYSLSQAWGETGRVWRSFFGFFGWMTVPLPSWGYQLWGTVTVAAILGTLWRLRLWRPTHWRRPTWQMASVLLLWSLLIFAAWLRFLLQTPAEQGRLLFPTLAPIAIWLTYALAQTRQRWFNWLIPALFGLTSLYALLILIPNAYAEPAILDELPPTAVSLNADMGQDIQLAAVDPLLGTYHPNDFVTTTTYWQATAHISNPQTAVYELWDQATLIGQTHTYHGQGRYPTDLWPTNTLLTDQATVRLNSNTVVPTQATLRIKLLDGPSTPVGTVKVIPQSWPSPKPPIAQFGDHIQLTSATVSENTALAGTAVTVTLNWQITGASPLGEPIPNLTTFIHLGDPTQAPLAQADGTPRQGSYPTHLWSSGERFSDTYILQLPPSLPVGQYPLQIGLYDPATGQRLPLISNNQHQPHDAYRIDQLTIYTSLETN